MQRASKDATAPQDMARDYDASAECFELRHGEEFA